LMDFDDLTSWIGWEVVALRRRNWILESLYFGGLVQDWLEGSHRECGRIRILGRLEKCQYILADYLEGSHCF
jgi:hypothetical protein